MSTRPQSERGIRDWDWKLPVCRALIGAFTDRDLVEEVLSRNKDSEMAGRVLDSLRKWRTHRPTGRDAKEFLEGLVGKLGCNEDTVTGAMLIDAPIDRFIGYLPPERQQDARDVVGDLRSNEPSSSPLSRVPSNGIRVLDGDLKPIWVHTTGPVESVATGLRAGKIDQRHYYLDPGSANEWSALVRAEAYPTYDHCKVALQTLVDSEPWNRSVTSARPSTAVMLTGGGAPTKDRVLLRSLLSQPYIPHRIHYYIVDISVYMLLDSMLWLEQQSGTIDGFEKVNLEGIWADVLKMTGRLKVPLHQNGNVIFGVTGGTIGNVSEATFFNSLNRASENGDLLILSADTIDGLPSATAQRTLIGKYNHPDFRRWIRPVVKAVLNEAGSTESIDQVLDRVKITLRPAGETHASDVTRSQSIILTLEIAGKQIILLTSTRYESDQLVSYAANFGWHRVHEVASPLNVQYKQFLFRRERVGI